MKTIIILAGVLLLGGPALGQTQQELDYLREGARAQSRQADDLHELRRLEYDRNLREDRAQRNFERDSRSSRRFDRRFDRR